MASDRAQTEQRRQDVRHLPSVPRSVVPINKQVVFDVARQCLRFLNVMVSVTGVVIHIVRYVSVVVRVEFILRFLQSLLCSVRESNMLAHYESCQRLEFGDLGLSLVIWELVLVSSVLS